MGMLGSKAARLSTNDFPAPPATPVRRKGVDKSQPGDPIQEISIDSTQPQTVEMIMSQDSDSDTEPLLNESEDSEEFDAEMDARFDARLDAWFADYAPKLFELNQNKWLTRQAKKEKSLKTSQPTSSQPPKKRRLL